jgi:hypothetical protein
MSNASKNKSVSILSWRGQLLHYQNVETKGKWGIVRHSKKTEWFVKTGRIEDKENMENISTIVSFS